MKKHQLTGNHPTAADSYIGVPADLKDPDAFACRVAGDSMVPKYRNGDIVIFSPADKWKDGDDCLIQFPDGQTTFKRVFAEKDARDQDVLRLQPRNERYRPEAVPPDKVARLVKAVFQYRKVNRA